MQNSSLWRAARPYPHSAFLGAKYFQGHQNPLENSASTWELRSWGRVSKNPYNSGLWARLFSPLLQSTFSYLWLVLICCTWITTEIAFRCSAPSQAEQLELASLWSLKNPPCPAWATVVCWVLFFVVFFFFPLTPNRLHLIHRRSSFWIISVWAFYRIYSCPNYKATVSYRQTKIAVKSKQVPHHTYIAHANHPVLNDIEQQWPEQGKNF